MIRIAPIISIRKKKGVLFLFLLIIFTILSTISSQGQIEVEDTVMISNAIALTMNFSTYFGGSGSDYGVAIDMAPDESCYVAGSTSSSNFPTLNAYNSTYGNFQDGFVSKFTSTGSLIWSTYFGGSSGDGCADIAVSNDGSCYIIGSSESSNFPTFNAYNNTYGGGYGDVIIAKFSANGNLLWSTFFGGSSSESGDSIAVTTDGSCYVIGETYSSNFPILNAFNNTNNGDGDAFIAKFSANGMLLWSTFFGGSKMEQGFGIAVGIDDSCYVTGETYSSNFPTLNAYDNSFNGINDDAYVAKFDENGTLLWSTFLGGSSDDSGFSVITTNNGDCYVTGYTWSSNFPTLNAYDSSFNLGWTDVFVAKFSPSGSLLWSTFLGGNQNENGYDIAVTNDDSCYVTGSTYSSNFPMQHAYNSTFDGYYDDAFLTKFSSEGYFLWSTYLGGINIDYTTSIAMTNTSKCYVIGSTYSTNFPILNAYDNALDGMNDAFITKFAELEDDVGPTISSVSHYPISPLDNESISILAELSDSNGISNATAYYKINSESWISGEMQILSGNYYYINIGPFNAYSVIKYYVEARDDSPNHNVAIDDNDTYFYEFIIESSTTPTTTTSHKLPAYSILGCLAIMPILILISRKRRE